MDAMMIPAASRASVSMMKSVMPVAYAGGDARPPLRCGRACNGPPPPPGTSRSEWRRRAVHSHSVSAGDTLELRLNERASYD